MAEAYSEVGDGQEGTMHSWSRAGLLTASSALTMGHVFQFKFELN